MVGTIEGVAQLCCAHCGFGNGHGEMRWSFKDRVVKILAMVDCWVRVVDPRRGSRVEPDVAKNPAISMNPRFTV